jgi:hypothetical protein
VKKLFGLAAPFFAISFSSAFADDIPPCPPPKGVINIALPDGLPAALRQVMGDIVSPGMPFDATDIVTTGHRRRYIFVWNIGSRWIVATEQGGRGYNDPIFLYDAGKDGTAAVLLKRKIAFPPTVCADARKFAAE